MERYYIIIGSDGTEIIDNSPEAENRIFAMSYLEERHEREQRRKEEAERRRKFARNPIYKMACLCGLV